MFQCSVTKVSGSTKISGLVNVPLNWLDNLRCQEYHVLSADTGKRDAGIVKVSMGMHSSVFTKAQLSGLDNKSR